MFTAALPPGAQQFLHSEVAPKTLDVVGVLPTIRDRPGGGCDIIPQLLGLHRDVFLQDDKFLTVAGSDLHVELIKLPIYHLAGNDDLRTVEVVGEQGFGGMLYYIRRVIYADVGKKRGSDFIIEPAEEEQTESGPPALHLGSILIAHETSSKTLVCSKTACAHDCFFILV